MKIFTFILVLSIIPLKLTFSAFEEKPCSARSLSLGGANNSLSSEASHLFSNPASLGLLTKREIQLSWSKLFGLEELSSGDFYLSFPLNKRLTLGTGYNIFGKNDYYQENLLILGVGIKVCESISLGTNLKYYQLSFLSPYGDFRTLGIDLGSLFRIKDKTQLGLALKNINQPELINNSEKIPFSYSFGISLYPYKQVLLSADLYKTESEEEEFRFGQEIKLFSSLALRFGMKSAPACYSLGTGVELEKLRLDYGYLSHPVLGGSHKVTLSFDF
ncbi:MAG: hypothetical protein MUO78_01195 [candidate division Zixibacteria bacterium]|nr:hypothetical protein [candidate division Zixibacteria bacterium]